MQHASQRHGFETLWSLKREDEVVKRLKNVCRAAIVATLAMVGAAQAQEPVKIGAIIPLSGPGSAIGGAFEKGLQTALGNRSKGMIAGRPFEIKIYDTEGNSTKAAQLFRRLADNDEVDVVIGPSFSGEALAVAPIANQLKVVAIASAGAEAITSPATPYMFSVTPRDRLIIETTLETFKSRDLKRIGLIYSLDGYGQSGGNALKELAARFGVDLVAIETFNMQDSSVAPQLIKIREANPDAVLIWANNPGPIIVLRNAYDLGLKKPFFVSYANTTNSFATQAGPSAEGIFAIGLAIAAADTVPEGDPRKPVLTALSKSHRERYGSAPDLTAGLGYDAVVVLEEALKRIKGPVTREAIKDAMIGIKACGSTGCLLITETDHRGHPKDAMALMQIKEGKWQFVQ
jgi:branched-chain amino acid transport system substrate-binding protein